MRSNWVKWCMAPTVLIALLTLEAAAWGPQAKRAIVGTAIQVIRRAHPDAFGGNEVNYEEDVLKGMAAGGVALNKGKPFTSEEEAIGVIDNEIKLLREVRKYGCGSFFAYHMGMLAAVTADLMIPFGLDTHPDTVAVRTKMETDIESHLKQYSFTLSHKDRQTVSSPREYFARRRPFLDDNRALIADDYRRGNGYDGFLREGGDAFFCQATEAVADVWHTVLQTDHSFETVPGSRTATTWYMVDEIGYLLSEKHNLRQALKAYENFDQVNPSITEAYEKVGDLFYAFGKKEAQDRGVKEWQKAYNAAGTDRREVGKKLAAHYIKFGEALLAKAAKPGTADSDLPDALNAFTQALAFDQSNETAATRLNETNTAITERKERRQLNLNIIASAEKVMVQAEKSKVNGDFSNAIATYNQAAGLFHAVDEEFPDQANAAKESLKDISKNITNVINQILDSASDAIDKGDKAVDEHKYEDAIAAYERVPTIVNVIPGEANTTHGKDRQELLDTAAKKIGDAKQSKQKWEATKAAQEEQAKRLAAGGGAAPPK